MRSLSRFGNGHRGGRCKPASLDRNVDEMVRYGARIDPEDRPKIVEYLSSVLGAVPQKPTVR
jgi:hypothetical protein